MCSAHTPGDAEGGPTVNDAPLKELDLRLAVIRDRVKGVALRHHTGLYLFGRAGTGKTHAVKQILNRIESPCEYHLGHLTPMGLFDLLDKYCDRTIVLDDVAEILTNNIALQILLAALGNQPDQNGPRPVKYRRQGLDATVKFTGGIILISNLELRPAPLLAALKSRVHYLRHDPSDEQIAALMRHIAAQGRPQHGLSPAECLEVVEFVIVEGVRLGCRPDIRLLVDKALPDFAQHRAGATETHWKDLVLATLEGQVQEVKYMPMSPAGRKDTKEKEQQLLQNILAEHGTAADRLAAWYDQTGKSERAYYRRLGEVLPDSLTLSGSVSSVTTRPPPNGHRRGLERCASAAPIAARTNVPPAALFSSESIDRGGSEPPERLVAAEGVRPRTPLPTGGDTLQTGEFAVAGGGDGGAGHLALGPAAAPCGSTAISTSGMTTTVIPTSINVDDRDRWDAGTEKQHANSTLPGVFEDI
jgi:hypothetical protein